MLDLQMCTCAFFWLFLDKRLLINCWLRNAQKNFDEESPHIFKTLEKSPLTRDVMYRQHDSCLPSKQTRMKRAWNKHKNSTFGIYYVLNLNDSWQICIFPPSHVLVCESHFQLFSSVSEADLCFFAACCEKSFTLTDRWTSAVCPSKTLYIYSYPHPGLC